MSEESALAKKKVAENYWKKQDVFESERKVTENTWAECYKYTLPRKEDVISSMNPGEKKGSALFDTTAIHANELLAAALHGNLTNPSVRFLEHLVGDPLLDKDEEIRKFLQDLSDATFLVLNNSNFQTEIHEIYLDLGAIGMACLFTGEDEKNIVHFSARSMREIFVDEDNTGRIDTVHRKFQWKLRQIVQEFGEKALSPQLLRKYKDGMEEPFDILHAVGPVEEGNEEYAAKKHLYKSCYTMKEDFHTLHEGGFRTFPYAVPRWTKTAGEKYGRGPGQSMLPDTKMVNVMMETTLQGGQLTAAPPFAVVDDSVVGKIRLKPFGMTVVKKQGAGQDWPIQSLIANARVDFGYQAVEDIRNRIRAGFFIDQFQLPRGGSNRTAEEVNTITDQNLRLMGPVLGRMNFELLDPLGVTVVDLMSRAGKLPPVPAKLAEAMLKQKKRIMIRFSSLIARAQRMSEVDNLGRALSLAAPVVNAIPEALDMLDGDGALKHIMDLCGVNHAVFRSAGEVKQRREARQEAQQAAAQQQNQAHQAEVASKVAPAAAAMAQMEAAKNQ